MGGLIWLRKEKMPTGFSQLKNLVIIGVIFSLHWITYFYSIKIATASIGILGASTYGIHLILLGWIFLKNKPRLTDWLALVIALSGTYVIIPELTLTNEVTLGLLLSITSGLLFAFLPILHQKTQHISNNIRSLGQYVFAIPLFLIFYNQLDFDLQMVDVYSLLYLGIFGTFLAHTFWINLTTKLPTTFTSIIFYVVIPMTMTLSYFWLGEKMPLNKIFGALMIISANILGISGKIKRKNSDDTAT